MEETLLYTKTYTVSDTQTDRFGLLRPAALLEMTQEVATEHACALRLSRRELEPMGLFWAIVRQSAEIYRLPHAGERIILETWPGVPTRTAFPRHITARTEGGEELFRLVALWLFMRYDSREMVLPHKAPLTVPGISREGELPLPKSLVIRDCTREDARRVRYSELDCNGHLNNTRYANWMEDVLSPDFHQENRLSRLHICYTHEALWDQELRVQWHSEEGALSMNAALAQGEQHIFSLRAEYIPKK